MSDIQPQSERPFFDGNPKMMYMFGLVSGMALVLLLNSFAGVGFAAGNVLGVADNKNDDTVVALPDPDDTGDTTPKTLAAVTEDDHVRGDLKKAKVVLIEYSDFECPFCERHHPTMQKIMDEYGDQVAWVYRHFPLSFHPEAEPAANASECAAEQGKFWEYGDELFANQDKLSDDYYVELAGELGLNKNKFTECFESSKYQSEIDEDLGTGQEAGVNGTPATFVNGQFVSGAVPYSTFKQIVDAELAK